MSNTDYDQDMSWDDAAAALSAAAQADEAGGTPEQASQPVETETPAEVEAPAEQPSEPVAQVPEDSEETFFNPDELPEELLPGWRQLQAAFTQKTQALAEQRRQFEQFGDPEQVENAVELYNRLSDPDNWPQLHAEITEALMEQGYEFADAQQMASEEMGAQAESFGLDDPDLAPLQGKLGTLEQQLAAQQAHLDQLNAERQWELEQAQAAQEHQRYVQYMQQQVAGLREAFPHYKEDDIEAIVQLGTFYNDDLSAAQARYDEIWNRKLDAYLSTKKAAPSSTPSAKNIISEQPPAEYETVREMEEDMVDLFRNLQAQGEIDW